MVDTILSLYLANPLTSVLFLALLSATLSLSLSRSLAEPGSCYPRC